MIRLDSLTAEGLHHCQNLIEMGYVMHTHICTQVFADWAVGVPMLRTYGKDVCKQGERGKRGVVGERGKSRVVGETGKLRDTGERENS